MKTQKKTPPISSSRLRNAISVRFSGPIAARIEALVEKRLHVDGADKTQIIRELVVKGLPQMEIEIAQALMGGKNIGGRGAGA